MRAVGEVRPEGHLSCVRDAEFPHDGEAKATSRVPRALLSSYLLCGVMRYFSPVACIA